MEREVVIVRDGQEVWRGPVKSSARDGQIVSVQQSFDEAWRQALSQNAVRPEDAGIVQFRFSKR